MEMPLISNYIERRRKEAKEKLEIFREFYKKENNPLSKYNKSREIVFLKRNEKKTIKSLRKIVRGLDRASGFSRDYMDEIECFQNLSQEEKIARAKNQLREDRTNRLESTLCQWVKNAESIFTNIIEENQDKMEGFEFFSSAVHGPIYGKIIIKNGKFYIKEFSSDVDYDISEYSSESKEITQKILAPINTYHYQPYHSIYSLHYNTLNKERNKIVKEIEKRTGRNLKKEVADSKRNQ